MTKLFLSTLFILSFSLVRASLPPLCGNEIMNIHENNPSLEGFAVQQFPSWDERKDIYKNGHPYIVFFKFKSKMDHIVFYSASGQVLGGEWKKLPESHWKKFELKPAEDLYFECRGNHTAHKNED